LNFSPHCSDAKVKVKLLDAVTSLLDARGAKRRKQA